LEVSGASTGEYEERKVSGAKFPSSVEVVMLSKLNNSSDSIVLPLEYPAALGKTCFEVSNINGHSKGFANDLKVLQ
jgi:hypothetical protein